jgi:hypothetical protein
MRLAAIGLLVLAAAACGERSEAQVEEQVAALTEELTPKVERAVGLPFKTSPAVAVRTRDQVRAYMARKMDHDMPPELLHGMTVAYRLFGLLPDTLDLRTLLVALYTEQVVGYYDPDSTRLYVVDGADPLVLKLTLAHELVHVLQGQYLRLDTLLEPGREGDRRMAAQAVLEGQATLASLLILMPDRGFEDIPDFSETYRQAIEQQHAQMPVFSSAPLIVRESIVFPYLEGANFVRWFQREHGDLQPYDGRMPQSTEQILHPERYRENDQPVSLRLVESGPIVHSDGLGEFETRILMTSLTGSTSVGRAGALAWAGDRYAVYEAVDGEHALVWWTAWDTAKAADRFATLLRRYWPEPETSDRKSVVEREPVGGRPGVRLVDAPADWRGWRAMPRVERR